VRVPRRSPDRISHRERHVVDAFLTQAWTMQIATKVARLKLYENNGAKGCPVATGGWIGVPFEVCFLRDESASIEQKISKRSYKRQSTLTT
jgi:hypothetical protein